MNPKTTAVCSEVPLSLSLALTSAPLSRRNCVEGHFLTKQERIALTNFHDFNVYVSARHCGMQWSHSSIIRRLDVCASVKEKLHQSPFLIRQQGTASRNLDRFDVSAPNCVLQWSHSVVIRRLDVGASVKEKLYRRPFLTRQQERRRRTLIASTIPSRAAK